MSFSSLRAACENTTKGVHLPEASGAAAHDFPLADEFGVKFGAVEGQEDVKVDTCRG